MVRVKFSKTSHNSLLPDAPMDLQLVMLASTFAMALEDMSEIEETHASSAIKTAALIRAQAGLPPLEKKKPEVRRPLEVTFIAVAVRNGIKARRMLPKLNEFHYIDYWTCVLTERVVQQQQLVKLKKKKAVIDPLAPK